MLIDLLKAAREYKESGLCRQLIIKNEPLTTQKPYTLSASYSRQLLWHGPTIGTTIAIAGID